MENEENIKIDLHVKTNVNGHYYINGTCNAYTEGLEKYYGHPDIQIVLWFSDDERFFPYFFGEFISRIAIGEVFEDGKIIKSKIISNDLRVESHIQDGKKYMRIVIADKNGKFPEDDDCDSLYKLQAFELNDLFEDALIN
ncbi:MAG: hypothetical protein ACLRT4_17070 [Thomasclavelia sp.]